MSLIIEDGTIVAGANSYTTDAELVAYAAARGKTLPATEAERDILQVLATDWMNGKTYKGLYVDADNQYMPFPRSNIWAYGRTINSATIPKEIKWAQMEAAIAAASSELIVNQVASDVKKEKLDVLEVEYGNGGPWSKVRVGRAMNYLKPFLEDTNKLVRT